MFDLCDTPCYISYGGDNVNTRIESVRKLKGKSQQQFAEILGLSKNFISLLENGNRKPSDRTIADICREFDINETWLRTGEGEMQREISDSEKILAWVTDVLMDKPDSFRRQLVEVLVELSPEQLDMLNQVADKLIEKRAQKEEEH